MRIVIIGEKRPNTMPNGVYQAMLRKGFHVSFMNIEKGYLYSKNWILNRILLSINTFIGRITKSREKLNQKLLKIDTDILLVFKGVGINAYHIKNQNPDLFLINWHVDDPLNPRYVKDIGVDNLVSYDMHLSSRPHRFSRYNELGLRGVKYLDFGVDLPLYLKERKKEKYEVTFVGNYSEYRYELLKTISDICEVHVWGSGWLKKARSKRNLVFHGYASWQKYIRISLNSRFALNILTPDNHDKSNLRQYELMLLGVNQLVIGALSSENDAIRVFSTGNDCRRYLKDLKDKESEINYACSWDKRVDDLEGYLCDLL